MSLLDGTGTFKEPLNHQPPSGPPSAGSFETHLSLNLKVKVMEPATWSWGMGAGPIPWTRQSKVHVQLDLVLNCWRHKQKIQDPSSNPLK